jgi:hypothetical protein
LPNETARFRDDLPRLPDQLSDLGLCIAHSFDQASISQPNVSATSAAGFHQLIQRRKSD